MRIPLCATLVLCLAASACTPEKKKTAPGKTRKPEVAETNADVDFQAFIGRLRKAVRARDAQTIASMMTPDFAYVLGSTPEQDRKGEGVFQYWEENDLWPELDGVVSEKFVQKDDFMVAPPQFAQPESEYHGYRAGIRRVNGSWKFVYFVNPDAGQPQS